MLVLMSKDLTHITRIGCRKLRAKRAHSLEAELKQWRLLPQVLALMSKDLTHMTRIECHKLRAKWTHILGVLRLTGAQSTQLIELRKSHLASLRALYEDRQRLNMQARPCCM